MDMNEWVILSDDGFLDADEKQILLGKRNSDSKSVFDMNYFCTSPNSRKITEASSRVLPKQQLVHVPIQLEHPRIGNYPDDDGLVEESTEDHHVEEAVVVEADQDTVSHAFFQIKENKFIDMKLDSPKSSSVGGRGVLFPPIDEGSLKFEEKGGEGHEAMVVEIMTSPKMNRVEKDEIFMCCDKEEEDPNGGFNLWKWSLSGVGAICSFGVAAATICVLFFGSQQRNKLQQNQKIRFQIYTDDKVSK